MSVRAESRPFHHVVQSFAGVANISLIASRDIWHHGITPIELHGTLASIATREMRTTEMTNVIRADRPRCRRAAPGTG